MTSHEQLPVSPPLGDISAAYSDVLQHNRRHTGFGAAFSAVIKSVSAEDAPTQSIGQHLEEGVTAGDMSAELQDLFHGDLFMRAGVTLAPLGSSIATERVTRASSEALVPIISNSELYKDFLATLRPDDLEQEPQSMQFFTDVAVQLRKMIDLGSDDGLVKDQAAQAAEISETSLRTWDAVSDEYARLGLGSATLRKKIAEVSPELKEHLDNSNASFVPGELSNEYQDYTRNAANLALFSGLEGRVYYWGEGLLPEFTKADHQGLFSTGDRNYYCDGLQGNIKEDTTAIIDLMNNPKTVELGLAARDAYRISVGKTLRQMQLAGPNNWLNFQPPEGQLTNRELLEAALAQIDAV